MKLIAPIIGMCLAGAMSLTGQETIPFLANAPEIDGKIKPEEWQNARTFQLIGIKGGKPQQCTEVRVGRDEKTLYVGFTCQESDPKSIKRQWSTPEERDNEIWRDDCVEVDINPFNSGRTEDVRQFIVNANGIAMDALNGSADVFNTGAKSAGMLFDDHWSVELAIPLEEVAYRPGGAELWSMNFCRQKTSPEELSVLRGDANNPGSFTDASHFEAFLLAPRKGALPLTLQKVTGASPVDYQFQLDKQLPNDAVLTATPFALDGSASGEKITVKAVPGSVQHLKFNPVPGTARLNVQLKAGSDVLYSVNFPFQGQTKQLSTLAHTTKNPLYRELWSDQPMGLGKEGAMFWMHGWPGVVIQQTAMQYGFPWVEMDVFKTFAQNKLWGISQYLNMKRYNQLEKGKASGMKWVYLPDNRWGKADIPRRNYVPFLFDPEAQKEYFNDLEKLREFPDQIYAVYFGDEVIDHAMIILIEFLEKYPDYQVLKDLDKEVRQKYGYGKFGVPKSAADPNVYRWIALRRCMNDKMIDFMKRVTKRVHQINPNIRVISDDPMASQNATYDYTDYTPEVCDIVTHQLYPRRSPDRADFSFITKYIADLSQVPEIWPCMHVEEYACSFSPDEVIEKVSEAVRGGATGIHYYLADTVGTRSGMRYLQSELFGAPERWQIEMALLKEMGKMNKLKFPEADCAIFSSITTLQAYVGQSPDPVRTVTIHSLLELQPKVFFRYFNEGSLAKKLVDVSKFKVVFVPDAKYIDIAPLKALESYVKNGGTLIVTDPEAFSNSSDGHDLGEFRKSLLGIQSAKKVEDKSSFTYDNLNLPISKNNVWVLTPAKDAKTVGTYNDGTSAVLEYTLGKGKVITFGLEIGEVRNTAVPAYQQLFKQMAKAHGLKCDQDIWRFRFPSTLIQPPAMPQGRCLTGNAVRWQKFHPLIGWNENLESASYSYSLQPTTPAETAEAPKYSFPEGHLTNRLAAIAKGNADRGKSSIEEWIVGWDTLKPFTITFDLGKVHALDRVEIIYNNYMRDLEIAWSEDGKNYLTQKAPLLKTDNGMPDCEDVRLKSVVLPQNSKGRFVQLRFAAPTDAEHQKLVLSEVEIWGPEQE